MTESLSGHVNIYKRDEESGALTPIKRIYTGTGVDNLEVEPLSGDILIGGHPNIWKFLVYTAFKKPPSPSEVVKIHFGHGDIEGQYYVYRFYMDNGKQHAAASVAAPATDTSMLIGSALFQQHIMLCSTS